MSTNKTQNYQLHSWLPQDEFHVSEINENFAALDAALKSEAQAAATGRTVLETAVGQRVRMVTGSYTGKGTGNPVQVNLGFKPKAVVIMDTQHSVSSAIMHFLAIENGLSASAAKLTATGFTADNASGLNVHINFKGSTYHYAAFY